MKKERKLSLKVISLFAALIGALSVTGVALASPPKTATNSQENSQGSQSQANSNSAPESSNNSGEPKKYFVKDFESGQTLKLSQKEFDEYMKKFKEKGYIELQIDDPEVKASIEKDLLKDGASGTIEGCYVKELKWDESKSCYVPK